MAEGVGAVVDDEVILVLTAAQEPQSVAVMQLHARVTQSDRIVREELLTDLHEQLVRLDDVDLLDLVIIAQLTRHAAVAAADHQHAPHVRMHRHRHMHDHLVIGELVLLREDHRAVRRHEPPELLALEDVDPL